MQDLQESFWGDFQGQTRQVLKRLLEADAEQRMAEYLGLRWHERAKREERVDYRNGFYERDYVTPLGVLRLRIPRSRQRSFLPRWIGPLERRASEVAELIRQAFLRGISTRQVGRDVATLTGEAVSAQTVSKLTRVAENAFHQKLIKSYGGKSYAGMAGAANPAVARKICRFIISKHAASSARTEKKT